VLENQTWNDTDFLGQKSELLQHPGIWAPLTQFFSQMANALHQGAVFETSD
jgi:hypothetical protein